jgi:hypothetical protein
MVGTVFVASLRHNDNGLVNMSGLNDYLYNLFRDRNLELPNGLMPAIMEMLSSETMKQSFLGIQIQLMQSD